ncbi:MAG: KUP/HAK/KT family potassium transporter, partial [Actinomycetota bacterium]|nr:KUP/HAK/KT family potassium transporter [Actinomycetota bacterium]
TSPLYALQTVFSIDHGAVRATTGDVYGVISLVFWSVTLVVSVKYVTVVMRADNGGEGGVMALAALAGRVLDGTRRTNAVIVLAILGASLFYGDSLITPAISVLSAVEGLKIAAPGLGHLVLPVAITILTILFAGQRFGTQRVGALFGPVMGLWFAALGLAGLREIVAQPGIVKGLSPTYAVAFIASHPVTAFVAMGAVVLCITGAEALYADMGHFGRPPIRRAWFAIVFPALTLNYLGQGALILRHPSSISSPFFLLLPAWGRLPMVVLATAATVIASQAVISGAFSVSRQAMQLGLLPPLTVRQTSTSAAGQVYLPAINGILLVGVLALMVGFRSSARLATAYGVAVTGALLIDTILLLVVARALWHWPPWKLVLAGVAFGGVEVTFFSANLTKVAHGGWLPLLIAAVVFTVMTTWQRGGRIVTENRTAVEGPLSAFIEDVRSRNVPRVPGTAVFPHPSAETTPLALRANVEYNGVLHANVVIVSARAENVPHVRPEDQLSIDDLGYDDDGIMHIALRYGFADQPNLPNALRRACADHATETEIDPDTAFYFVSRATLRRTRAPGLRPWRKALFIGLAHNAADRATFFGLPVDRTVVMGSHVDV